MNINQATLLISAVRPDQFPTDGLTEFAFAGKSNVGKSSLINALLNRKKLARVSQQPGKTRTINFYQVQCVPRDGRPEDGDGRVLCFADLPGYGYAKVAKSESAKWGAMIEGYLKDRPVLEAMFLLLDIRHEPGTNDRMLYDWCHYYGISTVLVATKSDKIKRSQIQKQLAMIKRTLQAEENPLPFSSETQDGRDTLWALMMDRLDRPMV